MGSYPGGEGATGRPQSGVMCAACGRLIPRDQYGDALCWAGPMDGTTVAAHRACVDVFDEILDAICSECGGVGWTARQDPILGGLIDVRCPECSP